MAKFKKGDVVRLRDYPHTEYVIIDDTTLTGYVLRDHYHNVKVAQGKNLYLVKSTKQKSYKTTTWLNPPTSPSTGSIVCYDGSYPIKGEEDKRHMFVEISDCHNKIRLHKMENESPLDFKRKISILVDALTQFSDHISKNC